MKLKPKFEEASKKVDKLCPPTFLVRMTAEQSIKTFRKYRVKDAPTLMWFVKGQLIEEYKGDHTRDAIVAWVTKKVKALA